MELQQAIQSRRAVREYTDASIDEATVRRLIDAAIQAPSAVNEQPWHFSVVRDRALMDRISKESKAYILQRPPSVVPSQHLHEILNQPEFDIFYRAPVLIVISSVTSGQWAIENCSLAAQNLMLAAYAEGLGSCWIGFAQPWLGTPAGKSALGLPAGYLPVAPIILGRPKSLPPPVVRKQPQIQWLGR